MVPIDLIARIKNKYYILHTDFLISLVISGVYYVKNKFFKIIVIPSPSHPQSKRRILQSVKVETKRIRVRVLITNLLLLVFVYSVGSAPAFADSISLDALFSQLVKATDELEARRIEGKIWQSWLKSGDTEIDTLMGQAIKKRSGYDFNGSLEILSTIIELKPDYAEAWNQRATVFFFQEKYEKSLQDIAKPEYRSSDKDPSLFEGTESVSWIVVQCI